MNGNLESTVNCPLCKRNQLQSLIRIENFPIFCNVLWPSRAEALQAPLGEISLAFCTNCGHIFNQAFEPEKMEYSQSYENSLHFSPRFQEYAASLATGLIERHNLKGKDIVEIGCGQGDFLTILCELGDNRGVGFDPSYIEQNNDTPSEQIKIYSEYFSEDFQELPVDLLLSRHVFEHIEAPDHFLAMIRRIIGARRQAVVFFEVPNVYYTLYQEGIWDILYEHYSYFSPSSLEYAFKRNGFRVDRVAETFGEQFLTIEAMPVEETLQAAISDERLQNLKIAAAQFASIYQRKVDHWQRKIDAFRSEGKWVVVWGAGTKGISFLNTIHTKGVIEYVVDINPRKKGMFISGAGQEIVPVEFLKEYRPDVVIVMNANYKREIEEQLHKMGVNASLLLA